jgi:tellurite resistance protein TerC
MTSRASNQHQKLRVAKRIVVAVVGGTVTLIGIALIVLPGPAFVVLPIGLSILATEFVWARRFLKKARQVVTRLKSKPQTTPQKNAH